MGFKKKSIVNDYSLTQQQKLEILRRINNYYQSQSKQSSYSVKGPSFLGSCSLLPKPRSAFVQIRPPLLLNRRNIKFQQEIGPPEKKNGIKKRGLRRQVKKKRRVQGERGKSITLLNSVVPPFTPKLRPKSLSRELSKILIDIHRIR